MFYYSIYFVSLGVKPIIGELIKNIERDQYKTGQAKGQSGNINGALSFIFQKITPCDSEIIEEHHNSLKKSESGSFLAYGIYFSRVSKYIATIKNAILSRSDVFFIKNKKVIVQ